LNNNGTRFAHSAKRKEEKMTAQKPADRPQDSPQAPGRKPWVRKSPVETILKERDKQRKKVADIKATLAEEEQMLQQFEEAAKIFNKKQ